MNALKILTIPLMIVVLVLTVGTASGQLMVNTGVPILIEQNAIVKVEGTVENQDTLINHGFIQIDSSKHITSTGITSGNGIYEVAVNWINDGAFVRDTSHVYLNGQSQLITGANVSSFYRLTLLNQFRKEMTLNSAVYRSLNINNANLHTGDDTMTIRNSGVNALQYDPSFNSEGYVSSRLSGRLAWTTSPSISYDYPLGSDSIAYRFRPLLIETVNSDTVYASFRNNVATDDGFDIALIDTTICQINPLYYHNVQSNDDLASLSFKYIGSSDGQFFHYGNWENSLWNGYTNTSTSTMGNFDVVTSNGWNNWNGTNHPFILLNTLAQPSNILGDSILCDSSNVLVYELDSSQSGMTYNWIVNGGTILNGQGTDNITVDWGASTSGYITVSSSYGIAGCESTNNDTLFATAGQAPIADFFANPQSVFPGDVVNFTNLSVNDSTWFWDFNNGATSTSQNPQTYYNTSGTYQVMLVAYNNQGCTDTAYVSVDVSGDIIIPNVITPNGDGINDAFEIIAGSLDNWSMGVYNRWGQLMYEGKKGEPFWTGRTKAGDLVPDGTYFYIFTYENQGAENVIKGSLNVFGNGK